MSCSSQVPGIRSGRRLARGALFQGEKDYSPITPTAAAFPGAIILPHSCEQAKAQGARTIILAFDEFWSQYRKGQGGKPRQLLPDTGEYVQRLAIISRVLKSYGLGLELSLLSPLELGRGYEQRTGESGHWVQYRESYRDPKTGLFTVSLWEQRRWTNNKGMIELKRSGIRVFAFRERRVGGTSLYAVERKDLLPGRNARTFRIGDTVQLFRRNTGVQRAGGLATEAPLFRSRLITNSGRRATTRRLPRLRRLRRMRSSCLANLLQGSGERCRRSGR